MTKINVFLLVLSLAITQNAMADFACRSKLSYKWKPAEGEERKVPWAFVEQVANDENGAKSKIEEYLGREKARAASACRELHENFSGCISAKLNSNATALQTATFSSRKTLQDAITEDCKKAQGQCLDLETSDPECSEIVKPAGEKEGGNEKDAKKEDKKGAGKGKK